MVSVVVRVDERGRVVLPKAVRERVGLKKGGYARVRVEGSAIVIEPVGSLADKYFGAFKVDRWPEDLNDFVERAVQGWWARGGT